MSDGWAKQEMQGALLRDRRARAALGELCQRLADQPAASFSSACGSDGRQAARRLFRRKKPGQEGAVEALLAGHYQETARRCAHHPLVLVAQDTTELNYSHHPATTGLSPLVTPESRGLWGHAPLALTPTGEPLGLLHLDLWAREPASAGQAKSRRQRPPEAKESRKWGAGLAAVAARSPTGPEVLLVQDREGDVFTFLATPRRPGRQPQPAREGVVTVRVTPLTLQPPRNRKASDPETPQPVWVVHAAEETPPPDVAPDAALHWVLISTRPVANYAAAQACLDHYALRWWIERLHYTLKSGCSVEALQIETADDLQQALALYYVVAWRLLWLTYTTRLQPEAPAETLLDPTELQVLRQATPQQVTTARETVRAIARIAGWQGYRKAPDPGVEMLWRGLRRPTDLTAGWRLAQDRRGDPIQP